MPIPRAILTLLAILSCGVVYAQKPVIMHRAPDVTAPTFVSGSINSAGTSLTLTFDEAVEFESSPNATGLTLTPSGAAATLTYASGTGTTALVYTISRTIAIDETATIAYSTTTGDIEDLPGNDLATFSAVAVTNNSIQQLGSLRPAIFPAIPTEAVDAGFGPNDLSTSVRTDVSQTSRGAVVTIAAGSYSSPYVASTANRTIRLLGDVTYDGAGIRVAASNITVDLNGYTLTYNNSDVEGLETGTVSSSTAGNGTSTYPTLTPSGLTLTSNSHSLWVLEFTSGAESGNFYEVVSNTTTVLTLENHNQVSDDTGDLRNWEDGGPSPGDTFRIYNPANTYGVGANAFTYPGGTVEVVNGAIVQGSGYGRGINRGYCSGMSPISYLDGGTAWTVGGVEVTWDAENSCGINVTGSSGAVIKYCEVTDNGTLVTNRQRSQNAIFAGPTATVQYNRIHNHRQAGIGCEDGSTVEYNEIYGDSHATNSTGAGTFSHDDVTIRYNNFYKVGQHPVCIGIAQDSSGAEVYGNWCEAQTTRESPEYGYNLACGLSIRWGISTSPNLYHDNAFIVYGEDGSVAPGDDIRGRALLLAEVNMYAPRVATTGGGSPSLLTVTKTGNPTLSTNSHADWIAAFSTGGEEGNFYRIVSNTSTTLSLERLGDAGRTWESGSAPAASDNFVIYNPATTGGDVLEDNFFGAYSTDDTAEMHCVGPMMGAPSTVLRNNTLVSTHNIFWFDDSYGIPFPGARFIGNTVKKSGNDAAFYTIRVGTYGATLQDLISTTFGTGTSASDIGGTGDSTTVLRFGYNLTVTVTDAGSPVEAATVTVSDKDGNVLRDDYLTNASGVVVVDVPTSQRIGPGMSSSTLAPLTVTAVKAAKDGTNAISPTSDDSITVTIE